MPWRPPIADGTNEPGDHRCPGCQTPQWVPHSGHVHCYSCGMGFHVGPTPVAGPTQYVASAQELARWSNYRDAVRNELYSDGGTDRFNLNKVIFDVYVPFWKECQS